MFGFTFKDLFRFDKMIAAALIKLIYWIGLVLGTLGAIGSFFAAFTGYGGGLGQALAVLVGWAVGVLFWRLVCEAWIVLFGIYERLGEVKAVLSQGR
ncbi:DUF4282 domain-containing protein [Oleisolibacter albus]|uniref:DUF4282 domain-containing protein n=1 Tax=Oleisolibacter albus TaxID=2171757 RepID=UPI000DF3242F|nr:DUF4282 domain-containing protein [Oleisolibacter albus]